LRNGAHHGAAETRAKRACRGLERLAARLIRGGIIVEAAGTPRNEAKDCDPRPSSARDTDCIYPTVSLTEMSADGIPGDRCTITWYAKILTTKRL
jgi:hypothetical protein